MITRADRRVLEALAHLENNERFKDLLAWISKSKEETLAALIDERDADTVRRLQGAAIDLTEILRVAQEARNLLKK